MQESAKHEKEPGNELVLSRINICYKLGPNIQVL